MGCRDCNDSLETCQNNLASETDKLFRAVTALGEIAGVFDEYDDAVRSVARAKTLGEGTKALDELVAHAFMSIFEVMEKWLLTEEDKDGF